MSDPSAPASKLALEAGQVLAGCYRIEAPIERGAMGAVFRATHLRLESPVAIKFLNPALAEQPDMLERFMREARAAALVRSSHVVQVFDCGVERGVPFIVMELLEGESLEQRLRAHGKLTPDELDRIFVEVARGLAVAHEAGIVHRDLKPSNIFMAREGDGEVTKVLDFGIAKWLDRKLSAPAGPGTGTGITLGTPHYMSPEQARGDRNIDHRSDLWSLAIVAFECLTLTFPFQGKGVGQLMVNICTLDPALPSAFASVPRGFDAWFLKAAAKDRRARFASATEMAAALHSVLCPEPRTSARSSPAAAFQTQRGVGPAAPARSGAPLPTAAGGARARRRARARVFVGTLSALSAGLLVAAWLGGERAPSERAREQLALRPAPSAARLPPAPAEVPLDFAERAPPPPPPLGRFGTETEVSEAPNAAPEEGSKASAAPPAAPRPVRPLPNRKQMAPARDPFAQRL